MEKRDGIIVSFRDSSNVFQVIAKVLLKLLSNMQSIQGVPEGDKTPRVLSDRLGLWPAEHEHEAMLCLYLTTSLQGEEVRQWCQNVRQRSGFIVLHLSGHLIPSSAAANASSSGASSAGRPRELSLSSLSGLLRRRSWDALAGFTSSSLSSSAPASIGLPDVPSANVCHLQAIQGPHADRPSFVKREVSQLASLLATQLAVGFRLRLAHCSLDEAASLYAKISMFPSALELLDRLEISKFIKRRCVQCGLFNAAEEEGALLCSFHPGQYASHHNRFAIPHWTCCQASAANASPCKTGVAHVEDTKTAQLGIFPRASNVTDGGEDLGGPPLEEPFSPSLVVPTSRILDASSYSSPSRQRLLALQCNLLSRMHQGQRLAWRVLHFVQLAWRKKAPELSQIEFDAWIYRIGSEAAKMAKPDMPPRLFHMIRHALMRLQTRQEIAQNDSLVTSHRVLHSSLQSVDNYVTLLRRLATKEMQGWRGRPRNELCVNVELGLALFQVSKHEAAHSAIRGAYHEFGTLGWSLIFEKCLTCLVACEEKLGMQTLSTHLDLVGLTGDPEKLLKMLDQGPRVVKPLEPHFTVKVVRSVENVISATITCHWKQQVVPDFEVELEEPGGNNVVVLMQGAPVKWRDDMPCAVRKVVCKLGRLHLVQVRDEVLKKERPALEVSANVQVRMVHSPLVGFPLILALTCTDHDLHDVTIWATHNNRSLLDPAVTAVAPLDAVVLPVKLRSGSTTLELIMACKSSAESSPFPAFVKLDVATNKPWLHRAFIVHSDNVWFVGVEIVTHSEIVLHKVTLLKNTVVSCSSMEKRFWFCVSGALSSEIVLEVECEYGGLKRVKEVTVEERGDLPWLLPSALSFQMTVLNLYGNGLSSDVLVALFSALKYRSSPVAELDCGRNDFSSHVTTASLAALVASSPSIKVLRLWDTKISATGIDLILAAITEQNKLEELDLGGNMLSAEPYEAMGAWLATDPSLRTLDLWYNHGGDVGARAIARGLVTNFSLRSLDLRDNDITDHIADAFVELLKRNVTLTSLFLQDNDIGEEGIFALSHAVHGNYVLEHLQVVDNLATQIASIPHIERIEFGVKRNRSFQEQLNQSAFVATGLGLSVVPPQLSSMIGTLHALDLSSNKFERVPEVVTQLVQLEKLSLARNLVTYFPPHYCSTLTKLVSLDLSSNRLSTFPAEVACMTNLRVLHLDENLLEMLPVAIGRMTWESFRVEGNPLSCIPPSTVAKGSRSILYYLKDLLSGGDYCYRVKLLVTGQANVGKTTLVQALKDDVGNVNKLLRALTGKGRRSSTMGISLEDWKPLDSLITFSTWDFGGQLVYYATHQFFLSKRSLYVLVFSLVKGLQQNRLLSWLNSIQSRAPGVPVMLVGTHVDDKKRCTPQHLADVSAAIRRMLTSWERSFAPNERLVIVKHSEDQWFHPVSAISGEGVAEVRSRLMNVAADQPSLRERVPRLYLQLLDVVRLQRRTENLPITSFARLREWAGFDDDAQLERAVQLLHDWGELLWFSESAILRDVVVLSPQWLTRMFATIISSSVSDDVSMNTSSASLSSASSASEESTELEDLGISRFGVVERDDLPRIWADYDPAHYQYFEKLLETFELWIPLDGGNRFLVPLLLPRRDVEEDPGIEWDQVRFGRSFWCPFPLHGLFERCMVQLLRLYSPVRYWRNEVVMSGPGTLKIFAVMSSSPMQNHPQGQRLSFYFASESMDELDALRSAVSSVMFVVHNFLMDWYNASLREQVLTEAICPKCCSLERCGTILLETVLRDHIAGAPAVMCPVCSDTLMLVDLIVELSDSVHSRSEYAMEVEELRYVADGSCSRVFQGRFRGNSIVAVKKLRVTTITTTWFLEFLQEISILKQLRHPSIVSIETAYLRPLCIVLEWIGGGTLDHAISKMEGPHDWPLLVRILSDIANGVDYLHSLPVPVFHRDLKSMNILVVQLEVTADPVAVKIGDLGSSCRSLGKVSGNVVHNPRWKPPELFAGNAATYTAASDVYCFGLIMWELVGRTVPFAEITWPSLIEDRILLGIRPSTEDLDVRPDYENLMRSCWTQHPEERPDARQVKGALEKIRTLLG